MKEATKFLDKLLKDGDTLVIGVSGGPDSMCLLDLITKLDKNIQIICAHVNHGLRKESIKEKKLVENYVHKHNIIFEYLEINDYKNNKFTESMGREKRYEFFNQLIDKYHANYLMTAHHGDDLIETVLMRLVRGSNLKGYLGIQKLKTNTKYSIARPLLYVTKKEIHDYLEENNIPYAIDKSNDNELYTRNRYRKHMLPFLKNEDKNVHLKFLKYSEELESYHKYVNNIVKDKVNEIFQNNKIDIEKINKEDKFLQRKIIEYIITDYQKEYIFNINDKQIDNILKLINTSSNRKINLASGFIARRSYNNLYIEKNKDRENYNEEFSNELIINNHKFIQEENNIEKSNHIIRLNSEEIKMPLYIRTKKDGDKMVVKNLDGTKKLKDIFIDSKIDIEERRVYPILVDSNDIVLWVPGIKKSKFDKEINEKYDIIIKHMEVNNE